jgi:uncharacterized membrane protein
MTQQIEQAQLATARDQSTSREIDPTVFPTESPLAARLPFDLVVALILTLAATASSLLEAPPALRVPLGVLLVLGLPGFGIVSSLFASDDGPDGVARIALSVALSLATVPFLALTIEWSPLRLDHGTVTIGLMIVSISTTLIAAGLRARLPIDERYAPEIHLPDIPSRSDWTRSQIAIGSALCIAAALFIFGGYDVVMTRLTGEPTTEMALYNSDGIAQFYPRDITIGDAAEVQVSIANHEGERVQYQLVVAGSGQAVGTMPDLTLADGETWQGPVRFTVTSAGTDLPVRFELYRLDNSTDSDPYRLLILIVNGEEPSGAQT